MTVHPALSSTASALGAALSGLGRAAVLARDAVDPDARRDLAWLPVVALASVAPKHSAPEARVDDGHRPVIFVHGLAGHRGHFGPMRGWLGLHGRTRSYALGLTGATLAEKASELQRFIDDVYRVNDLPDDAQVDLVAHSMGGLVSRMALRDLNTSRRVHTLVTLATPHGGTHAARFAGGELPEALRRDSEAMQALSSDAPWQHGARLVCLWSRSDPLMQPAETATLPGADNRELEGMSHFDWLMRRAAWMEVCEALGG